MNQVPVLFVDVSCTGEYFVLIIMPVLTSMRPSRKLFADLRLPEQF